MDDPMALLHEAEGNSASGHPQHRGCGSIDCCTERYEIVVLLPNSELTKGNNKPDADAHTVRLGRKTMAGGLFKLPITLLFEVRNIKCGYSGLQIYGGPGSLSHDFKIWPITFQGSEPS